MESTAPMELIHLPAPASYGLPMRPRTGTLKYYANPRRIWPNRTYRLPPQQPQGRLVYGAHGLLNSVTFTGRIIDLYA